MKVTIPASITNNGTGMHNSTVSVSLYEYPPRSPELTVSVGMGVATISNKNDALKLAAMILQIAQRLP